MKKRQPRHLSVNTFFSMGLAVVFIAAIALAPDYSLFAAAGFLVAYVAGNGIIHYRKNQLSRDTLVEYILVALAAFVVLIGALL